MPSARRNSFDDDKAFNIFMRVWVTCVVLGIGLWAGIIYVAIHFIGKVW